MSDDMEVRRDGDWGREAWRQPTVGPDETLIFNEPGRVLQGYDERGTGVDCRSHSFSVVKPKYGEYHLKVKHGGGEESYAIGYSVLTIRALEKVDSDGRYWLLHNMLNVIHNAQRATRQDTASEYAQAFAEGRLKKRRRNNRIHVEIQPRVVHAA